MEVSIYQRKSSFISSLQSSETKTYQRAARNYLKISNFIKGTLAVEWKITKYIYLIDFKGFCCFSLLSSDINAMIFNLCDRVNTKQRNV